MWKDPIVEEMREASRSIAEEEGYDIHRMAERFRREQLANTEQTIIKPNRPAQNLEKTVKI